MMVWGSMALFFVAGPVSEKKLFANETGCGSALSTETERPWVAAPRTIDYPWMSVVDWCRMHKANLADPARTEAKLAFLGDSIVEGWTTQAPDLWQTHFAQYHPLRLGIGGDKTQNLLWRLQRGELKDLSLKALVLLIGTNNFGLGEPDSPEDLTKGVSTVLDEVRKEQPQAKVILMAIFPRGEKADDPLRVRIAETNSLLKELAAVKGVLFYDINDKYLDSQGSIPSSLMADFLHPTHEGYRVWANALDPVLQQVMQK
jgi:lysophospholipase L1-like esterase